MNKLKRYLSIVLSTFNQLNQLSTTKLVLIIYVVTLSIHSIYAVTHNTFLQDSARDFIIAENNIDQGRYLVDYGPKASVGKFYLPPFYYQLQLVMTLIFPSQPMAIRWLIVLVESATPVLLFLLFRLYLPKQSSTILAIFYATFHQVMIYSSQSWNPNMIPFFTTAFLVSWLYFFKTKKIWLIYFSLLSLGIAWQLHYQTFVLLPFAAIIWLFTLIRYRRFWIDLIAAPILASVTFWPYLRSEIVYSFPNTQAIKSFFTNEHSLYYERVSKPDYVLNYFPKFIERLMFSADTYKSIIGRFLFFGGFLLGSLNLKVSSVTRWLFLYFGSIFVMLRVFKGDKLDYYLMTLFILPIVLLSWIAMKSSKAAIITGLIAVVLITLNLNRLPAHNYYRDLKSIVKFIEEHTDSNDIQVVFHELSQVNYFYFGFEHFSDLHLVNSSSNIIDICSIGKEGICTFDNKYMCKSNTPDDETFWYGLQPKWHNNYQVKATKIFGNNFVVTVGSVDEPKEFGIHPQLHDQQRYGSDLMFLP